MAALGPGALLTPALVLVKRLGSGSQGDVYEVADDQSGEHYAVKLLPKTITDDSHLLARLRREAQTAAAIDHPSVIRIFGLDSHADHGHFLRMELLLGETLDRTIKSGPIPIERALKIADQIAAGLQAVHDAGIIHRDIKPANLFVASTAKGEQIKVMDFGIAKGSGSWDMTVLTQTGTVMGTPAYMSPEQAMTPDKLDPRSDQYSFGIVLFELLTGRRPFVAKELAQILMHHIRTPAPDPRTLRPEISEALAQVVLKCLAKKRDARFSSMREVAAALRRPVTASLELRTDVGLEATLPTPPPQRGPKRSLGVFLAVAAIALVGSAATWLIGAPTIAPTLPVAPDPTPMRELQDPLPAAAVAPAPDAPKAGILFLTSEPSGAAVREGEALLGRAPVKLELEPNVEHVLLLDLTGFKTESMRFSMAPGTERLESVKLSPLAKKVSAVVARPRTSIEAPPVVPANLKSAGEGFLTIDTDPWTKVFLRGAALGTTPLYKLKLPEGEHTVRLVNEEAGIDTTRIVTIHNGKTEKLSVRFPAR